MEHLVHVEETEITINFELGRKCKCELRLRSLMHTMPVAFKLQTTSPFKFSVRPSNGYIRPLAECTLEITLRPQQELPPIFPFSDEKFVLKTALAPISSDDDSLLPEKVCKEWFASPTTHIYVDAKLKVVYVGAHILRQCVTNGDVFAVEQILLRQNAISAASEDGRTALHVAASMGNSKLVNMLLQCGADVDAADMVGRTPLWEAITGGHVDSVKELLAHGARTGIGEPFRSTSTTPIHVAAKLASPEVLKLLIESGAALETKDEEGRTALHFAVDDARIESLKVLLRAGADVNAQSIDGRTPLLIAANNGSLEMVHLLLEGGAKTNIKAENGNVASGVASEKGHVVIVEALQAGEELLRATRRGDVRAVTTLLQHGGGGKKAWAQDSAGWTALHVAAFKGHVQIVRRLLLAERATKALQERDAEGHTPLHCAAEGGSREVVELLLAMGANPLAASSRGATPAELASALGFTSLARLLQQRAHHPAIDSVSQGQLELHAKGSESMCSSITMLGPLRQQSESPDPDSSSLHVHSVTPSLNHKEATTASSIRFSTPRKLPSQQQLHNKQGSASSSLCSHADEIPGYLTSDSLLDQKDLASSRPQAASTTGRFKSSDVTSVQHPEVQKLMGHAAQLKHPLSQPVPSSASLEPPTVVEPLKATGEEETATASHLRHSSTGQICDHRKDIGSLSQPLQQYSVFHSHPIEQKSEKVDVNAATSKPKDIALNGGSNLQNFHQHTRKQTLAALLDKVHGSNTEVDPSSSRKSLGSKVLLGGTYEAKNQRDGSTRRKVEIPSSDMYLLDKTTLHQDSLGGTKHCRNQDGESAIRRDTSAVKEVGISALHTPSQDRASIQKKIKDSRNLTDGDQECPRQGAAPLFQRHKSPAKQVAVPTSNTLTQNRACTKIQVKEGNNQHPSRQDPASPHQRNKSKTTEATTPTSLQRRVLVQNEVKVDRCLDSGKHNSAKQDAVSLPQRSKSITKEVAIPTSDKDRAPVQNTRNQHVPHGHQHPAVASSFSKKTQPTREEAETRRLKSKRCELTHRAEPKGHSQERAKVDTFLSTDNNQAPQNSRVVLATKVQLLAAGRSTRMKCEELSKSTGNAIGGVEDPSFDDSVCTAAKPQFIDALDKQNNVSSTSLCCRVDDGTTVEDTSFSTSSRSLIRHGDLVHILTTSNPADSELWCTPHREQACPSLSTSSPAWTSSDQLLQSKHNRFASPDPSQRNPTPPQEEMMREIRIHTTPSHQSTLHSCRTDQMLQIEETQSPKPTCKASWNDQNRPIYTPPLRIKQMRRPMSTPILRNSNSPRQVRTEEVPMKATGTSEEKPVKARKSVTFRELFTQGIF